MISYKPPISCFFCTILRKRGKSSPESVSRLNKTLLLFTVTKIPDYLEKEQVDEILNAAKTCNHRDYLLLRFMWRTGVRVSEVINVTPKDIEYKNGVVNIRKAKGGRQRRVPLDQDTLKMLSDYVLALNIPEDRPVFPITTNSSIQPRKEIREYGRRQDTPTYAAP